MNEIYKLEIIEKTLQFIGLFYFTFWFFVGYAWCSKQLDFLSNRTDVHSFWNPIAAVIGFSNIGILLLILISIYKNHRPSVANKIQKNRTLFYALFLPLFLGSIVYVIFEVVKDISESDVNACKSIGELCLFCGTLILVINIHFNLWTVETPFQKIFKRFVILVSFIGIINDFLFHIMTQQVYCFIEVASGYPIYSQYYNESSFKTMDNIFHFKDFRNYMLPFSTIFCLTCTVYLGRLYFSKDDTILDEITEVDSSTNLLHQSSSEMYILHEDDKDPKEFYSQLRSFIHMPPLSLILGIMLFTIALLIISLKNSFITGPDLQLSGQYLISIFPIPIYFISIGLLYIQIREIERWPNSQTYNIVDTILIWIGAFGQLVLVCSHITMSLYMEYISLSIVTIISSLVLLFQIIIQTLALSLSLNRNIIPPQRKSWQEFICPAVGLLSVNLSFLSFNIYSIMTDYANKEFNARNESQIFLRFFGTGFHSLGDTLSSLQRLHSSLIFMKMIIFTSK